MSTGFRGNRAGSYQQTTFPANRAVITNSEGRIDFSPVTSNEVGYLANARSNIQEQIDGISSDVEINSFDVSSTTGWSQLTSPPNSIAWGAAVVYDNEIHTLSRNGHYKWNGTNWVSVSTLPYNNFTGASAVVFNNEIHIFGGINSDDKTKHYKWDGTSWTEVSTLPYEFYVGSAVVYNNEIHILCGLNTGEKHYKWDGTSWSSASITPFTNGYWHTNAVVYNNEIHVLGGEGLSNGGTFHYKWDGTSWSSVSTLPYDLARGGALVFRNEIHIFGGNGNNTAHYKWNGSSWSLVSTLPANFMKGVFTLYENNIHIITADYDDNAPRHYQYITSWYPISAGPYTYAYDISSDHYESDSRPIWMLEGVNGLPTSAEYDDIFKIGAAIFDENGIMLLATEQPSSDLKLIVKGV
jgi:hypothetical protein